MSEIQDQACAYYKQLEPLAERFLFERPPPASEVNGMPIVLFLGNHSSGKSSFINYILGERVQRTGIAPIDDGFTILMYAEDAVDRDGAAVVTNPDLGFEELKNFGEKLTSHLRVRTHDVSAFRNIALIDSPGMIDAADSSKDRGYDFPEVVRWFALRADVILFLFDPDKPGTTGETVHVLRSALDGLDHKVLLVFNKVDRFESMRDYARAYGALCWNLARAFSRRKDMPHIYNTYLRVDPDQIAKEHKLPLDDFDAAREEVLAEVYRAPQRRLDNVVSRLYRYTRRLRMHAQVISERYTANNRRRRFYWALGAGVLLLAGVLIYGAVELLTESVVLSIASIIGAAALGLGALFAIFQWTQQTLAPQDLFRRVYAKQLTLKEKAPDLETLWTSVEEKVNLAFATGDRFKPIKTAELRKLDKIVDVEVPRMRAASESARPDDPPVFRAKDGSSKQRRSSEPLGA